MTSRSNSGFRFSKPVITGSHAASAHAVANGVAEIAAIDAVSWKYISKFDGLEAVLKVLDHTPPTPALPYITAKAQDASKIFDTLRNAIQNLEDVDKSLLCLKDLARVRAEDYLELPMPAALSFTSSRRHPS